MDMQEACDSGGWGREEEGKSRRKGNDENYLKFIDVLRSEYAQRLY